MLYFFIFTGVVVVTLLLLWHTVPFVPAAPQTVVNIIDLVKPRPGEHAIDLGSGDGRVVLALARRGAYVDGIEINPRLVRRSRRLIKRAGLGARAHIRWGDLLHTNLSSYDIVVFYGARHIMPRLAKKMRRELKSGASIVSLSFKLPGWQVNNQRAALFLYKA